MVEIEEDEGLNVSRGTSVTVSPVTVVVYGSRVGIMVLIPAGIEAY